VEAVFEGPAGAVDALVSWCGEGPPMAKVGEVDVVDEVPEGDTSFSVR
jgi:acylphosphatase